jgi:phycoerythrin-associated linker protein
MTIENFLLKSEGEWRSMRSGHSLAFQQFEEVLSQIKIIILKTSDLNVINLLEKIGSIEGTLTTPFEMEWCAESDWEPDDPSQASAGKCIFIPIKKSEDEGLMIRSIGYAEAEQAISSYKLLSDNTFVLTTKYGQSIAEERIWFVSDNIRCRSSVLKTASGAGVLQTSFSSEVRRLNISDK